MKRKRSGFASQLTCREAARSASLTTWQICNMTSRVLFSNTFPTRCSLRAPSGTWEFMCWSPRCDRWSCISTERALSGFPPISTTTHTLRLKMCTRTSPTPPSTSTPPTRWVARTGRASNGPSVSWGATSETQDCLMTKYGLRLKPSSCLLASTCAVSFLISSAASNSSASI